jgi:pSer/pThr/pTyr-binding forkhead associated (FHA) protein
MPLALVRAGETEESVEMAELPLVIGRSDDVDVRVGCRWASRRHCEIDQVDGAFVLRDLGSRHGTIVNGKPVREATLNPGDEIGVGLAQFIVRLRGSRACTEHVAATEVNFEAL